MKTHKGDWAQAMGNEVAETENIRNRLKQMATIKIDCQPEDLPVRGNVLASGDDELDKQAENEVIAQLNNGNQWAWSMVRVTATIGTMTGESSWLGRCSYGGEKEFIDANDYYGDLLDEAIDSIIDQLESSRELAETIAYVDNRLYRPLYRGIAASATAYRNCVESGNTEWEGKHLDNLHAMEKSLPSGSGIDCGTKIDIEATNRNRIVLIVEFHHMHESGMYDGWTSHKIIVTPSFDGFNLRITGHNKNGIKEYLSDVYYDALAESWEIT